MGRLNRWAALLMEFNFIIKHIKGSSNTTADNLSRLPVCLDGGETAVYPSGRLQQLGELPAAYLVDMTVMADVQMLARQPQEEVCDVTVAQIVGVPCREAWEVLPVSITDVSRATREDRVYGKLFNAVRCGKLDSSDKDLGRFNGVFSSLYIGDEVLYFGTRVVIPIVQQQGLLEELHFSYIGATKMKETVRRFFW